MKTEEQSPLLYIIALDDQSQYAIAMCACLMSAANVASCVRRFMSVGASDKTLLDCSGSRVCHQCSYTCSRIGSVVNSHESSRRSGFDLPPTGTASKLVVPVVRRRTRLRRLV